MTKRKPETSRELVVRTPRQTGPVRTLEETRMDHLPVPAQAATAGPMTAGVTHTIQTTFRPDVTITVDDTEYQSLLKQGLVYSGNPVTPTADAYDLLFADKIQHGTATRAELKAAYVAQPTTGAASATTYLRGDGSWATPAGGGGSGQGAVIYSSGTYPARSTVTSSTTTPVTWVGPVDPVASGALAVDIWENTGASV